MAEVYLLGTGASDSNDGATSSTPVATFEKAKSLLAPGGTIYLGAMITINGNVSMSLLADDGVSVGTLKRRADYTSNRMITVSSAATHHLTLSDIIIDGNEDITTTYPIIYIGANSNLTLNPGTVLQNGNRTATQGGAIQGGTTSALNAIVNIDGAIIRNNSSTGAGGAISIAGSTVNIRNSIITGNSAGTFGGAISSTTNGTNFYIYNTLIQNNSAGTTGGGAIYTAGTASSLIIEDSVIDNNTMTAGAGGAIYNTSATTFNIINTTISNHSVTTTGGAVHSNIANATVTISGSTISSNTAAGSGGGVYVSGASSILNLNDSTVEQNTSSGSGGGVYISGANSTLNLNDAIIQNNTLNSSNGGGIYASSTTINFNKGSISDNTSTGYGAAISLNNGTLNMGDMNYVDENNISTQSNSEIVIANNVCSGNYGGAVYATGSSTTNLAAITMWAGTFRNNRSEGTTYTYGGGAIYNRQAVFTMYGGLFTGNYSATRGGALYNSSVDPTTAKLLGGEFDSTNVARTGVGDAVFHSAQTAGGASYLHVGGTEFLSSIYLDTGSAGEASLMVVDTLDNPVLVYVGSPSEGRVVAVGEDYTLTQSDVSNILIQTTGTTTWYVALNANDEAILTQTPPSNQLSIVFIDGVNGSDNYAGNTPAAAVKTFAEARRRLIRDGIIYIVNTVTIDSSASWELPVAAYGTASIRRYAGSHGGSVFTGTMIEVTSTGNLSLANIILNGGGITSNPIISNNGTLNVAGLTQIGVDEFDGGVYLNTGKLITLTGTPESGSRFNIENVAESVLAGRVVGTRAGVTATELIASYFAYLPAGARVIPDGNNYILDSAITATSVGLTNVVTGVPFSNAKIIFTLLDGEFADDFNSSDFLTSTLASQIASISTHPTDPVYAGTPVKTSPTTIEIPIHGTPTAVRNTPFVLTLPTIIPMANIDGAVSDIPVAGTISIYPIKYAGADVTVPVLTAGSLAQEALAVTSQIDGANPGSQTVQYAISTINNANVNSLSWVSSGSFTHLEPETAYYVYSRSVGTDSYYAGTAQVSVAITTLAIPAELSVALVDTPVSIPLSSTIPEESDDIGVLVTTNSATGYIVNLKADDLDGLTTNDDWLECSTSSDKFTPLAQNGLLQDNTWGWNVNSTKPSTWNVISTSDTQIAGSLTASGPNSDGAGADTFTLWFGAKMGSNVPACVYSAIVVISAVARP